MATQTANPAKAWLPTISLKRLKKVDWSYFAIRLLAIGAAVFVLTYRLSGATYHRFSYQELVTLNASASWHNLLANPLFLPYKLLEWLILQLGGTGHIFAIRLAPVIFALITLWLFLAIARRWFSRPTYLLATILFGSSLYFLHFGRLAVPTIMLALTPLAIVRLVTWFRDLKKDKATGSYRVVLILPLVFALTLYVPGAWLLWLAVAVWQYKKLVLLARKLPWQMLLAAASLALLLLVPLVYGLARNDSLVTSWLGISTTNFLNLSRLELIYKLPLHYLAYGPLATPAEWLGRQPILDVFSAATALVGLGYYCWHYQLRQAKLLAIMLAAGLVLYVISDGGLDVWVGIVYLLVAAGIGYLLQIWRRVFPRNPVAYGGALFLIGLVTALAVFYTTKSYYTAWHYHPATKQAFSIRL